MTTPFVAGTSTPARPRARGPSVATTTCRADHVRSAATTEVPSTRSTRWPSRTRSPSGAATCSGSACMPAAGSDGTPRANIQASSRAKRSAVLPSSSRSTPAKNRSTTRRSSPSTPAWSRAAARSTSARPASTSDSGVRPRGRSSGRGPPEHRGHLARVAERRTHGPRQQAGSAHRVPQDRRAGLGDGRDAGPESLQAQGADVDPAAYGGVGRVEELEAAVDEEAVDPVGADPAADGVRRLQHDHLVAGLVQDPRTAQSRQPGSHHQHVGVHAATLVGGPKRVSPVPAGLATVRGRPPPRETPWTCSTSTTPSA